MHEYEQYADGTMSGEHVNKNAEVTGRNTNCIRPSCGKQLSEFTAGGRRKNKFRLEEQKYCSDTCARRHYHEQIAEEKKLMERAQATMDKFIYSGFQNGKISKKPLTR